ncbi:MAG TPA: cellulase family glycosylhydrolase [Kiritimatiellia bacterium]|nr:cellulase family glycosylhydrolase [Kiritimatiellia bacterium]HRU71628.1 cellulase family glycosylhydrolase [Kiritimatiellia bacterium]
MTKRTGIAAVGLLLAQALLAGADRLARVDAEGVLRWADTGDEVALLGVNYYTPFTIDYAALKRQGRDHRQVMRDDVAHFRRLGLGCIRVHCFERQFSDREGNLLDNEHLALLDELIDICREQGIYTVLTPIAWWGGGIWTERTQGFSDIYSMRQLTADRSTWPAQARFLKQFAEHVNRITGRRYADEPCVLAFECINEPLYPPDTPDSLVTDYINTLTDALRASGTAKPIYYNSWHGRNAAAGASRVDGVTCVSYPTGLVAGRELEGPQLSRVRATSLQPDASIARKSRMVYEFDAADMNGSYMYPAMALLFRSEGIQVASQFQYDPMPLADVNRNWQTHHLNLVYTPNKALSLAIAAEVLARMPRGTTFTPADDEMRFPPFRVSATENLSELVTETHYFHSNATRTPPPAPDRLERVWGCGVSPLVASCGSGAYFLDRVAPGVWRLQLYPDVFTVADPFTGTTATKVRVLPICPTLTLRLPDLGVRFAVRTFADGRLGESAASARDGAFTVAPGDYLLTRDDVTPSAETVKRAAELAPRWAAPPLPDEKSVGPLLRASVQPQWRAGHPMELYAEAALATQVVARLISGNDKSVVVTLTRTNQTMHSSGHYKGVVPGDQLAPGVWNVAFSAHGAHGVAEYPGHSAYDVSWAPLVPERRIPLLHVPETPPPPVNNGLTEASVTLVQAGDRRALRLSVADVGVGRSAAGYTRPFAVDVGALRPAERAGVPDPMGWGLRIVARGDVDDARVEIGFKMKNGQGLGYNLRLGAGWSEMIIPAVELIPLWGLPKREAFCWKEVTRLSVLTGAWLYSEGAPQSGVSVDLAALEWVALQPALRLNVVAKDGAWSLFDVDDWMRVQLWHAPLRRWKVRDDRLRPAIHLGAERFDGEHGSLSLRVPTDGRSCARLWQTDGADAVLVVRARAAHPRTTAFELALIQDDNVAWGTNVPLTIDWQTHRIPLRTLKLFSHWDKKMTEQAGPHLRLSRLAAVSVCFGKWLYPKAAAEPHGFEISAVAVEP